MLEQISDTREPTLTEAAVVRFDSGMGCRVGNQTLPMGEGFVALVTLIRPLAGVHPDVHLELALVQETGPAKVAQVALDAHVLDHVRVQRRLGQVARVTFFALVLLVRAAVGLDVDFQLRSRPELLTTGRTDIVLPVPPGMLLLDVRIVIILDRKLFLAEATPKDAMLVPFVLVPVPVGGEGLDTDRTEETAGGFVPLRVPQIVGLVQEHLVTNAARIMDSIQFRIVRLYR